MDVNEKRRILLTDGIQKLRDDIPTMKKYKHLNVDVEVNRAIKNISAFNDDEINEYYEYYIKNEAPCCSCKGSGYLTH